MTKLSKYQKLTDIEHVLKRPGRYLGSINEHSAETWYVNGSKMVFSEISWNPALIKMFDEVISNSVDHSKRPEGKHLKKIEIYIDPDGTFSVRDDGGIPVKIHPEYDQWIPEMIFAELRSGSNFDDNEETHLTGQNGEGASLTNIFSTYFKIETSDKKKKYVQEFFDNLSSRSKPKITNSSRGFTKITWKPDYSRLGTSLDEGNFKKIEKRIHDIAATNPHLQIFLNGERIKYSSFEKYISMYTDEYVYCSNSDWKIGIAASNGEFRHVSFVNCTETSQGGTHIEYITKKFVESIREHIKKKYKIDVKPAAIRSHLMLFIDASIVNPRYDSQTKERLITEERNFKTSIEIPQKVIRGVLNSNVISSVIDWVNAKQREEELAELRKKQKANKKKRVATHINANSRNREKCVLFIAEGQSALNKWIDVRDRNYHGAFPLKGKPLNVRDMTPTEIVSNKEISNIMAILGLEFGKKAKNLNYGEIRLMTDADVDGSGAIVSLLLNFFSFWPELFDEGRIKIVRTPIIVATHKKKKEIKRFYDMSEFEQAKLDNNVWLIEYMKGLGSLSNIDYDLIINSPILEKVRLDDPSILQMAFGPDAEVRKEWLMK